MTERKLVVITTPGFLPELGGCISGPVKTPASVTIDVIRKLLIAGKTVFECNPADPRNEKLRVKLNLNNYRENNFSKTVDTGEEKNEEVKRDEKSHSIPKSDITPVVPEPPTPSSGMMTTPFLVTGENGVKMASEKTIEEMQKEYSEKKSNKENNTTANEPKAPKLNKLGMPVEDASQESGVNASAK